MQLPDEAVSSQLLDLQRQLRPYSGNAAVKSFLDCLRPAIEERLGLYQWLARDGRTSAATGRPYEP